MLSSDPIPIVVPNWAPRPLMYAPSMIGQYVRTDPINFEQDIPFLWDALGGNDDTINDLIKWYGLDDLNSQDDLHNLLKHIEDVPGSCINIFRLIDSNSSDGSILENEKIAGMASFIATQAADGCTEVGYVAHGLAMAGTRASTEAHYLLAKHTFETMGYRRYEWKCHSQNLRSGKAALRYGFSFEGCFRQHRVTAKGWNRDTNYYSMLDSEWPNRKAAMQSWLSIENFDEEGNQKQRLQDFRSLPSPSNNTEVK